MNAFGTNFKVSTKVKVYNPYGSFTYKGEINNENIFIKSHFLCRQ